MLAWGLGGWENWGVMAKGCSISFCGNENVLKLWWMHNSRNILQATEYTLLSDWTVCYINYISTKLLKWVKQKLTTKLLNYWALAQQTGS